MSLTFSLGDLTVHRIVELNAPFAHAIEMLPDLTPALLDENRGWISSASLNQADEFILCYQSYLVRTPHHTILVDSCLGDDKPRPRPEWHMRRGGELLAGLAKLNVSPGDIDYVMCTHLHTDHVGWNTRLIDGRWVPTFPNARYVFGREEYEATLAGQPTATNCSFEDSVLPIVAANRADLVESDFALGDHVRMIPTPGHTAGHVAIALGRGSDRAVMSGDLIHVPLQARYPELSFFKDTDPALAALTRRAFLESYCDTDTLCCSGHFPSPSVGHVRRWDNGFRFIDPA